MSNPLTLFTTLTLDQYDVVESTRGSGVADTVTVHLTDTTGRKITIEGMAAGTEKECVVGAQYQVTFTSVA